MSFVNFKKSFKGYYSVFRIRMINSLQYRAAALAGLTTQFFWGFMLIMIFEAFYASGGSQDFSFDNLVTYIWLQQAFLTFFNIWMGDRELGNIIVNGNISYELVRPYSLYGFWYAKIFGGRVSNGLLRFPLVILVVLFLPAPYSLSLPAGMGTFFVFLLSFVLGICVTVCIVMLMFISMFKTHDLVGPFVLFGIATDFLGGHYIPIPLMPEWLQKASDFLPFRYTYDLPVRIYTGYISGTEVLYGILIQIMWVAFLFALGQFLMRLVSKKVVVYGG